MNDTKYSNMVNFGHISVYNLQFLSICLWFFVFHFPGSALISFQCSLSYHKPLFPHSNPLLPLLFLLLLLSDFSILSEANYTFHIKPQLMGLLVRCLHAAAHLQRQEKICMSMCMCKKSHLKYQHLKKVCLHMSNGRRQPPAKSLLMILFTLVARLIKVQQLCDLRPFHLCWLEGGGIRVCMHGGLQRGCQLAQYGVVGTNTGKAP